MRAPISLRRTLSVLTTANNDFDLGGFDTVNGAQAAITLQLTTPAAAAGTQICNVIVGTQTPVQDYIVPGEEYAGAGPNARIPAIPLAGLRGDRIRVNVRNPTGGTVVTTLAMTIQPLGR